MIGRWMPWAAAPACGGRGGGPSEYHHPVLMRAAIAVLPLLWACGGCSSPPGGFDSPDPAARTHAIAEAARTEDAAAIPELIALLDSDDAAVRLLSIRTLERLTGRTMGYEHYAPEAERREAVRRWVAWARGEGDASDEAAEAAAAWYGEHAPQPRAAQPGSMRP